MRSQKQKSRCIIKLFRITFFIGRNEYAVIPLHSRADFALKAFRLRKLTGDRRIYKVSQTPLGIHCQCKAFKRWRRCQHVQMLRAAGMLH